MVTSNFRYSYSIKVTWYSYKLLKKVTCYTNEVTCNLLLPNTVHTRRGEVGVQQRASFEQGQSSFGAIAIAILMETYKWSRFS